MLTFEVALMSKSGIETSYPGYERQRYSEGMTELTFPYCHEGSDVLVSAVFLSEKIEIRKFERSIYVSAGVQPFLKYTRVP